MGHFHNKTILFTCIFICLAFLFTGCSKIIDELKPLSDDDYYTQRDRPDSIEFNAPPVKNVISYTDYTLRDSTAPTPDAMISLIIKPEILSSRVSVELLDNPIARIDSRGYIYPLQFGSSFVRISYPSKPDFPIVNTNGTGNTFVLNVIPATPVTSFNMTGKSITLDSVYGSSYSSYATVCFFADEHAIFYKNTQGNYLPSKIAGNSSIAGFEDGTSQYSRFNNIVRLSCAEKNNSLYVVDHDDNKLYHIRKYSYLNNNVTTLAHETTKSTSEIEIATLDNGTLFFLTETGFYSLQTGASDPLKICDNTFGSSTLLRVGYDGRVYLYSGDALYRLEGSSFQEFTTLETGIVDFCVDQEGSIYFASGVNGLTVHYPSRDIEKNVKIINSPISSCSLARFTTVYYQYSTVERIVDRILLSYVDTESNQVRLLKIK